MLCVNQLWLTIMCTSSVDNLSMLISLVRRILCSSSTGSSFPVPPLGTVPYRRGLDCEDALTKIHDEKRPLNDGLVGRSVFRCHFGRLHFLVPAEKEDQRQA